VLPDSQEAGEAQEASIRARLLSEGYTQPYGASDDEIRKTLGITGKCADFVGYHPELDRWLIAESKGGNLEDAEAQLANTLQDLLTKEPGALGRAELRVYISANQYDMLGGEPPQSLGRGGYYLREVDNYLGTYDEKNMWSYRELRGIRILAVREANDE
jgi:hypothetical protein